MPLLRVLTHAVIIIACAYLLRFFAQAARASALVSVLNFLSAGWYIILALVTSAAMHNQKSVVIAICTLVSLGSAPFASMDDFAHTIVPIGVGILLGTALRPAIREWSHDRAATQPVPPDE
ncbi:MAG TPA: hypothetical protein VF824_10735 [Thermoanaerobaculia bacterium]|jgi:hypothetical protein